MSALFEQCVLCSLSDNLDLLGVESCPTKNEVIVTNKSRKITIYEVENQKHIHGWSVKADSALTSPAISSIDSPGFVSVQNQKVIRQFNRDQLNIDKGKKIQSKYAVHRLLNIDQKEALVVFENGYVSRLHQIHEDSAAGPNRERIVWCEGIHSSSDTYVCVLTQENDKLRICSHRLRETWTWERHSAQLSPPTETSPLATTETSVTLKCCCLQWTGRTLRLLTLWSNHLLCAADISDGQVSQTVQLHTLPTLGHLVDMIAISKSHLAILGIRRNVDGVQTDGLAIFDTQFGTVNDWKPLSKHNSSPTKIKLYRHHSRLLFAWNKQLVTYEYHTQPSTLGSVLGKIHSPQDQPHVFNHWTGTQTTKKQKVESSISRLFEKLIDSEVTPTQFAFSQTFGEIEQELLTVSPAPVISEHLMRALIQRCEKDKKVWPRNELQTLAQLHLIPASLCKQLFTLLVAHGETSLLHTCLACTQDIPETALVLSLQYYLSCDESKFSYEQNGGMKEQPDQSTSPFSHQRASHINAVLCLPYNDVFLIENLRKLDFQYVLILSMPDIKGKSLLKYLHHMLVSSETTLSMDEQSTDLPSLVRVVDWMNMLLDAHFTQMVLSVDARSLLVDLHQMVALQVQYYDELGSLEAVLSQLKEQCALPQKKNNALYSIEVLHIH